MSYGINKSIAAYGSIKENILCGKYKTGQYLNETELCNALGISRTPVREALKRLNEEGFVQHDHNKGNCVTQITKDDVREIFEARASLEVYALKLCIQKSGSRTIASFKKSLQMQEKALGENNSEAFKKHDLNFHHIIIKGSKNKHLEFFWLTVIDHVKHIMNSLYPQYIYRPNTMSLHLQLLSLMEEKDYDLAVSLLEEHIMMMRDEIINKMKEGEKTAHKST